MRLRCCAERFRMLIYLNGSINAGKSTVGRLLAAHLPRTVHIEVDELRHFADCLSLNEVCLYCLEDTVVLSKNWIKRGFNVVVSWPISEEDHAHLCRELVDLGCPIHTFTLRPRLDIALADRGERRLTPREKARIQEQYRSMHIDPGIGTIIDNSDISPEETVSAIISHLQNQHKS